jgi:hypothetical protein
MGNRHKVFKDSMLSGPGLQETKYHHLKLLRFFVTPCIMFAAHQALHHDCQDYTRIGEQEWLLIILGDTEMEKN